MAPRMPILSAREVLRALGKVGFQRVGQKGSHIRLKRSRPDGTRIVIVPSHAEITPGTLRSILRQAGLPRADFLKLL